MALVVAAGAMGQEVLGCMWDTRILASEKQRVQVQLRPEWVAPGVWGSAYPPEWSLICKRRLYVKVAVKSVTLGDY